MMNYQIADLAIRFSVGGRAYSQEVFLPRSSLAFKLATLFSKQGLIQKFCVQRNSIKVTLKYVRRKPLIKQLELVSTPGRRVY
jgi:ribosomal protein S8